MRILKLNWVFEADIPQWNFTIRQDAFPIIHFTLQYLLKQRGLETDHGISGPMHYAEVGDIQQGLGFLGKASL